MWMVKTNLKLKDPYDLLPLKRKQPEMIVVQFTCSSFVMVHVCFVSNLNFSRLVFR